MLPSPKSEEIDTRTVKLLIGVIALTLANLTSFFSQTRIASISASYYEGGWAQTFFVGFLFAIAAFMLSYNGMSTTQMILAKVAAFAALGVALFPCGCDGHDQIIANVHGIAAAVMFIILAWFCYIFFDRARAKPHAEAQRRRFVYLACGLLIVAAISVLGADNFLDGILSKRIPRLTFYGERIGLVSFGVSWLTASKVLPLLSNQRERLKFFGL